MSHTVALPIAESHHVDRALSMQPTNPFINAFNREVRKKN
jgi:hypothetical protein